MGPGNIWAVAAVFTLGVGLGREAGGLSEESGAPQGGHGGQAGDRLCPAPSTRVTTPCQDLLKLLFLSYEAKVISQVMQNTLLESTFCFLESRYE